MVNMFAHNKPSPSVRVAGVDSVASVADWSMWRSVLLLLVFGFAEGGTNVGHRVKRQHYDYYYNYHQHDYRQGNWWHQQYHYQQWPLPQMPPIAPAPAPPRTQDTTPTPLHLSPTPLDSSPTPIDSSPTPLDSSPTPLDTSPTPLDTSPTPIDSSPTPLDSSPTPLDSSPTPLDSSPTPLDSSPTPLDSSPTPLDSSPSPLDTTPLDNTDNRGAFDSTFVGHLREGDECTDKISNSKGVCCRIHDCKSAYDDLSSKKGSPNICSFSVMTAIVCCRYGCAGPPNNTVPAKRPGDRSKRMCLEYQKRIKELTTPQPAAAASPVLGPVYVTIDPPRQLLTKPPSRTRRQTKVPEEEDGFVHIAAVGGEDADVNEYPHMAAIGWPTQSGSYSFNCGGSLISEKWVLTAGHCLNNQRDTSLTNPEPTIVRLGNRNILEIEGPDHIDVPISKRIKHPNFKPPMKYYDIALLRLARVVTFSDRVQPICLWHGIDFEYFSSAWLTGWGTTVAGGRLNSAVLQKVKLDLLSNEDCDHLLTKFRNRNWQGFVDHQLCAGVLKGGHDACQGDSGGPLQLKSGDSWQMVGITSFGQDCAIPNQPGVYTRVSSFVPWIEDIVWP